MSKWARIENGIVMEITDIDPEGRFTQEIVDQFHVCPDDVEQGWKYENIVFSKPTPPALEIVTPIVNQDVADMWEAIFIVLAEIETLKGGI